MRRRNRPVFAVTTIVEPLDAMVPTPRKAARRSRRAAVVTLRRAVRRDGRNPEGPANKYELDHATGRIRLDRMPFTSTRYPADYGYIEHTLGQGGDPLDALVLLEEPTFPGCLITCRALGMFRMTDEAVGTTRCSACRRRTRRMAHLVDIEDVSEFDRLEIQHFFETYKDLEPGKSVEGASGRPRGGRGGDHGLAQAGRGRQLPPDPPAPPVR